MPQQILNTPRETTHQRIAAALEAIEQNMSDEHEAVNIDYDNTYSGLSADNVQEAIDELVNEKANTADLGTASAKDFTTSVTQGSTDLVTSGAVYNEFANLPKPEIFKGTLGVNGTITSLPTASSSNEGWEYKVITDGTYAGQPAKYGDTFISDGTQWVYIPSGDETDTDTWRGINVNGSQLLGNGISSGNVNFKGGTNAQVSGSGNDVTVDVDTTFSDASSRANIASGDSIKTILGKIKKWFADLKTVAFTGAYSDLSGTPTIPTKTSDLTNDSGFINTVDSTLSDSSTNPLQNKVITKELEGTKTTSGNPLTIEDAAPVNAVNLSMDLEPIQDLHGYDHPWVGGAGKNKLPMTVDGIKSANTSGTWNGNVYTLNGVTFTIQTDSDGNVTGIKANGTAIASVAFNIFNGNAPLNGSYTLWSNSFLANGRAAYTFNFSTHEDINILITREVTDTFTNDALTHMHIFIWSGTQLNNVTFQPMIAFSSESSTFAPYSNICPISGRSEVAIQRVGKNWVEDTLVGARLYSSGAIGADSYFSMQLVRVIQGLQYTVTVDDDYLTGGFFTSKPAVGSVTYDGTIIDTTNKTFIAPITGWFAFRSLVGDTTTQLELGSTATTYEPYAGKTYTIQLGETVYGGTLDVTRGKMVVDRGYKTIADFESMSEGGDNFATGDIGAKRFSPTQLSTIISSHCPTVPQSPDPTQFSISGLHWVDGFQLWNTGCTNFNELKERYGELQVCYELATPFTIDLTPTQIKMLENTNTITTDYEEDTIHIEYQPNNAIGEAVRAVEESYDPEFAVRPVLKKKAFSGTTDTDGSVTLINASDIPSGHKIIPLHITDMTIDGNAGTYFVEYEPYNSGDAVKGYCYFYMSGSQMFPVGKAITGNFYYYDLEG